MEKSTAEIRLKKTWDLFSKSCFLTIKDLPKLEEAFVKSLIKIEELALSRQKWRARAEDAERKLKEISTC